MDNTITPCDWHAEQQMLMSRNSPAGQVPLLWGVLWHVGDFPNGTPVVVSALQSLN